jgi:NADH-quinone oxidoreductase subunit L
MADLIWLVPVFPLLGFLINSLLMSMAPVTKRRRTAGPIAAVCSGLAFVVAAYIAWKMPSILGDATYRNVDLYEWIAIAGSALKVPMGLRIDALSMTMTLVVTGVGTLIHIFSIGYMADDERVYRYFSYLNLFMLAMLILVLGSSYLLMFVGWEGVGLASYLLIGFFFEKVSAAQAGKKAFLVNRVGDFGFLLAMFAIFWLTGSLTFNTPENTGALDQAAVLRTATLWGLPAVTVIALLLLLGATGKSAQLPLYLWLPDAMEGPTPVSALIHAATMVTAGVYMIARSAAIYGQSELAQAMVAWVGILTALWAAVLALKQYDIKRVLAYSTVSQLGYMFVGVGVGAYAAGISHLVTHAFFKALMFLGAGAVMHALEGQLDMRKMGNMKRYMPVTYATFACGWAAICGVPLLSGFWSKDAILEHVWHHAAVGTPDHPANPMYWAVFVIGVFTAGLTAFYMTRMFVTVFHGSERIELGDEGHGHATDAHGHGHDHGKGHGHGHGHVHVHPEQRIMNFPLQVLAVGSVLGGVVVFLLPGFLHNVTTATVPHEEVKAFQVIAQAPHANTPATDHGNAPTDETHVPGANAPGNAPVAPGNPPAGSEAGGIVIEDEHGNVIGGSGGAHAGDAGHGAGGHAAAPPIWSFPNPLDPNVAIPTAFGTIAGLLGIALAWKKSDQFARGWPASTERVLGAHQAIYEGALHAVFVKGGTRFAELLYTIVDRTIDWLVNGVAAVVDYFAESLRTLQTGYVRNYALVMLAGAVFVVACFMIILQHTNR